jgi:hypothetical protein
MSSRLKKIEFTPHGSITTNIGKVHILQLGLQAHKLDERSIPIKHRGVCDYFLLRLASTFGKDRVTLKQGMLNVALLTDGARIVAHDMYPRTENEVSESEVELGLDTTLTWGPISMVPKLTYKTKIRKINTFLVAGGLLTAQPWWRFETRKGEKTLLGCMETLLTVQVDHEKSLYGEAELTGRNSGFGSENTLKASFNFKIQ